MKKQSLWTKNLADTTGGWWIFNVLFPLGAIALGVHGIVTQKMSVRGAPVSGLDAIFFGTGWLLIGLGWIGFPGRSAALLGGVSKFNGWRLGTGVVIGVIFFLIGAWHVAFR